MRIFSSRRQVFCGGAVMMVLVATLLLLATPSPSQAADVRTDIHARRRFHSALVEETAEVELTAEAKFSVDEMWNSIKQSINGKLQSVMSQAKKKFEEKIKNDPNYNNPTPTPTTDSSSLAKCKIPKASATVLSRAPAYDITKAVATNTLINGGYARLAECMQLIANGNKGDTSASALSANIPVWFAIAPYASRVVGRSQLSALMSKQAVKDMAAHISAVTPGLTSPNPVPLWNYLTGKSPVNLSSDLLTIIGAMLVGFADSLDPLTDVNVVIHMMKKFVIAVTPVGCKGFSCCPSPISDCINAFKFLVANVEKVPDFLVKYLMQGNIGIYGDIGASAEQYLKWRDSYQQKAQASIVNIPKDKVLSEFCKYHIGSRATDKDVAQCNSMYDTFIAGNPGVDGSTTQAKIKAVANFNAATYQKALKTAAFAAFEEAGKNAAQRDTLLKKANNALAWVEQHYAVVPAFIDVSLPAGHLARKDLFHMTSPLVNLKLKTHAWSFYKFLRAPAAYPNWADFTTRWGPILDSFNSAAYPKRADLWPMPGPFAAKP